MFVGAALYIDVLKPASVLSLTQQEEKLDTVQGLKAILKSAKSLEKMAEKDPLQFPRVSLVCGRIKEEDRDGSMIYQGAAADSYTSHSIKHCTEQALDVMS